MQKGRPTIGDSLDFIPITHALGQAFRLTIAAPVSGPRRALSGNVIFPLGAHIPTHFIPRRTTMTWIANDDNSTAYFSARSMWRTGRTGEIKLIIRRCDIHLGELPFFQ